jgi:hypothetical protein
MIKPEFIESESLAVVSYQARLTFVILLMIADDDGRFKVNRILKSKVFPLSDELADETFEDWLWELEAIGSIRFYLVENLIYGDIPKFSTYQTINRKSKTYIPEFHAKQQVKRTLTEYSLIIHEQEHSLSTHGGLNEHSRVKKEGKKEGTVSSSFVGSEGEDAAPDGASSPMSLKEFKKKNPDVKMTDIIKKVIGC